MIRELDYVHLEERREERIDGKWRRKRTHDKRDIARLRGEFFCGLEEEPRRKRRYIFGHYRYIFFLWGKRKGSKIFGEGKYVFVVEKKN